MKTRVEEIEQKIRDHKNEIEKLRKELYSIRSCNTCADENDCHIDTRRTCLMGDYRTWWRVR